MTIDGQEYVSVGPARKLARVGHEWEQVLAGAAPRVVGARVYYSAELARQIGAARPNAEVRMRRGRQAGLEKIHQGRGWTMAEDAALRTAVDTYSTPRAIHEVWTATTGRVRTLQALYCRAHTKLGLAWPTGLRKRSAATSAPQITPLSDRVEVSLQRLRDAIDGAITALRGGR